MLPSAEHNRPAGLDALEKRLGYRFSDRALLETALTHSSCSNERRNAVHNERLEFLGDAVLEICVSEELYARYPQEREGGLTRLRSRLVGEEKLAELAKRIGLGGCLRLGRGEDAQGGRERPALLADAMEAVLGAAYLDGGQSAAASLVARLYEDQWPLPETTRKDKDFKTRLQEVTQAEFHALPSYLPKGSHGPEHARTFEVELHMPDGQSLTAKGPSLKRAEQAAAAAALNYLETRERHA